MTEPTDALPWWTGSGLLLVRHVERHHGDARRRVWVLAMAMAMAMAMATAMAMAMVVAVVDPADGVGGGGAAPRRHDLGRGGRNRPPGRGDVDQESRSTMAGSGAGAAGPSEPPGPRRRSRGHAAPLRPWRQGSCARVVVGPVSAPASRSRLSSRVAPLYTYPFARPKADTPSTGCAARRQITAATGTTGGQCCTTGTLRPVIGPWPQRPPPDPTGRRGRPGSSEPIRGPRPTPPGPSGRRRRPPPHPASMARCTTSTSAWKDAAAAQARLRRGLEAGTASGT